MTLRIVYVDHVARLSGGELALIRLIEAMGSSIDPLVILAESGPLEGLLEARGIATEILPLSDRARDVRRNEVRPGAAAVVSIFHTVSYTRRLAKRLRQLQPDIVHTNSLKAGFYGTAAARLVGVPSVWHLRDRVADDYLPRAAVSLTRLALALLPDVILCNSQATRHTLGRLVQRTRVIPSPVVYDPYAGGVAMGSDTSGDITIGIVGRLAPWKGQDVFLRAFAAAFPADDGPQARLIGSAMFGEDDYAASLETLARELGIAERVTFVGFSDEVELELAKLHILVHASTSPEPFGQVVVEGMAAGLAVVATDAGGPTEIITPDKDGILVRAGDVAELANVLVQLVESEPLRRRLGAAGRLRAADFVPAAIGPQVMTVYEDLLQRRRATGWVNKALHSRLPVSGP